MDEIVKTPVDVKKTAMNIASLDDNEFNALARYLLEIDGTTLTRSDEDDESKDLSQAITGIFRVVLYSYPHSKKIPCIRWIREFRDLGLYESKTLAEHLPCVVSKDVTWAEAKIIENRFASVDATVAIRSVHSD